MLSEEITFDELDPPVLVLNLIVSLLELLVHEGRCRFRLNGRLAFDASTFAMTRVVDTE